MAEANRPIVRGYVALAAVYYAIMTPVHFFALSGVSQLTMVLVASCAALVSAFAWKQTQQPLGSGRLEFTAAVVNTAVYGNVMAAIHTNYDPSDLIYFPMMALAFAFTSVTMRLAIASISVVLCTLFNELTAEFNGAGYAYFYIGFAAAISGLAFVVFLQRAIQAAIQAKEAAESRLVNAEDKLEEAELLSAAMHQRALTDSLTELPNRRAFFEFLNDWGVESDGSSKVWLIALDLDGFKMVNDVYGHIVGDELLKTVSKRMQEYCGPEASVSRIGGDEFNIILQGVEDEDACLVWCEALLEEVSKPYDVQSRLVQLSASIGCTELLRSQKTSFIIRNADFALLHAKKTGKNRVVVFTDEHQENAKERFKIEDALRSADFSREIKILFQPQVDLARNQVVRAEALARWDGPALGMVEPDRFIKIAEESGLISKITLAVLDAAITTLKGWEHPVPLAINLSGHDLLSNQVMDEIIQTLEVSELDPSLIEFEVTETAMMADTEKACDNLNRLSKLGFSVALDDFGTGYSNFNYLRELPIDKLKIDRSFVEDIGNPMTEKILHSLTVTANALGVNCLLEGVEDEIQLVMAKRVGAHAVQGYIFGKPMQSEKLIDMMGNHGEALDASDVTRVQSSF
ncbi:MAG: EAL domain-containing protein [Erythrobacter sp.]|uniref:putative bifunctional diguanylate cyclase/phosphodiesterase n=1 Tax=Erythrobacter sp. TaxID=1042 RepID=UPI0032672498